MLFRSTEELRGSEKILLIADVDRTRRVLSEMLTDAISAANRTLTPLAPQADAASDASVITP